ncbi:Uncharacterised protein [Mycobacteroides abscessus subsp. abscessus]|nr:Uncharacterised protein [Mycobacteroides abscessus subsp. abscessus]
MASAAGRSTVSPSPLTRIWVPGTRDATCGAPDAEVTTMGATSDSLNRGMLGSTAPEAVTTAIVGTSSCPRLWRRWRRPTGRCAPW